MECNQSFIKYKTEEKTNNLIQILHADNKT